MLSLSIALSLLATPCTSAVSETYLLDPSDDAWVYPHASDPAKDPYLRVWGVAGVAAAPKGEAPDDYSYSYMAFDLSPLPKNVKLIEASLNLFQTPDPGYTADASKAAPIEIRTLVGGFAEKGWDYSQVNKVYPDPAKEAIIATGFPEKWESGKPVPVQINLLAPNSGFPKLLPRLLSGEKPVFQFALTSRLDPSEGGRTAVYKLFSKDGPKETRPVLKLVIERG